MNSNHRITISTTSGCKLSVAVEDEQKAIDYFSMLSQELIGQKYVSALTGKPEVLSDPKALPEAEKEEAKQLDPGSPSISYRGFIHFKCPFCGKTTNTNMRNNQKGFTCPSCGNPYYFTESLRKVHLKCSCGEEYSYWTNLKTRLISIDCISCKEPMTAYFNEKAQRYEG
jgi:hypothetical protein|nr:MAG TPA: Protein involved in formate dehydrogenase formation [Caudoviricetes sp.]